MSTVKDFETLYTGHSIRMVPDYVSDVLSVLSSWYALQDDDQTDVVSSPLNT